MSSIALSSAISSDAGGIYTERRKRLEELYHLALDPLFCDIGTANKALATFSQTIDGSLAPVDLSVLPGVSNKDDFVRKITESYDNAVFRASAASSNASKRKAPPDSSYAQSSKAQRLSGTAFSSAIAKEIEERTNQFLDMPLKDLEVLTVPQHYPTKPHAVSSLAELYYLTQTLPLIKLLPGSHKTLMTENFEAALLEGKIAVLYSRIEELKRQKKWSLRQPIKYNDPFVFNKKHKKKSFHWDNLAREASWMSADFRESLKYRKACCLAMAQAVQDYWSYGADSTTIKYKQIVHIDPADIPPPPGTVIEEAEAPAEETEQPEQEETGEATEQTEPGETAEATTETDAAANPNEMAVDEPAPEVKTEQTQESSSGKAQSAQPDDAVDVSLLLRRAEDDQEAQINEDLKNPYLPTPIEDVSSIFKVNVSLDSLKKLDASIIRNLPKFSAFDEDEIPSMGSQPIKPSAGNQIVPVSKLLYPFDDDDGFYKVVLKDKSNQHKGKMALPEYQKGLFGSQAHRRFNYLKAPKPPLIKNIEYRSPTIWLPQDDKYLIHYVAEFCFNWDLISEHLASTVASMNSYESNIERRTPWQCFERYIQLNEKFQFSDMKGPYAYHAQQWLEQAHRAQATTKRRISPLGVGNESIQRGHRRLRWASMFDAMRKCMKKRENQTAKMNSRRSADYSQTPSASKPNDKVPTPAELSRLKFDRDKTIQEAYLNQRATRTKMMAAVSQAGKNGPPSPTSSSSNSGSNLGPRSLPPNVQDHKGPGGVSPTNNNMKQGAPGNAFNSLNSDAKIQGINAAMPNAAAAAANGRNVKRPTSANGTPYTPEQIQQLIQIQKQRRLMQQQQQQAQNKSIQGNAPAGGMIPGNAKSINTNMMNNNVGNSNMAHNTGSSSQQQVQPSNASRPRIQFAPAQVSAIINSIQTKNPGLSKEQVTKLAATYLANLQQQQQNRLNQQQRQGVQPVQNNMGQRAQSSQKAQPQVATLTPQERNQLQMLKAAKNAQQQQLQQQQLQQLQQRQQQQLRQQSQARSNSGSPVVGPAQLNQGNLSRLDYEQRKRLLIQKHQQQQLQQQQQRSGGGLSPSASSPGSPSGSSLR